MKATYKVLVAVGMVLGAGLALPASAHAGTFPGKNGKIAFTSHRDGNGEIYSMNPDGTGLVNLTNHPGKDRVASWSPDGTKIAFQSDRHGKEGIYVMNADGSNQLLLTKELNGMQPSWSADGTKIAFVRQPAGSNLMQIYTMNADGTNQVNISNSSAQDYNPSWSPDGTKILFNSTSGGGNVPAQFYTMNPDGTSKQQLGATSFGSRWNASWSPDGANIIYQRSAIRGSELFIANAATGVELGQFLNEYGSVAPSGAWSPDGTKITYSGFRRIHIANTDGTNPTDISSPSPLANDTEPVWQPLPAQAPRPTEPTHPAVDMNLNITGSNNLIDVLISWGRLPL